LSPVLVLAYQSKSWTISRPSKHFGELGGLKHISLDSCEVVQYQSALAALLLL
jgi:hypothetical protein